MRIYTNIQFSENYPIFRAAVVVARSKREAAYLLNIELESRNMVARAKIEGMVEVDPTLKKAIILSDGNY